MSKYRISRWALVIALAFLATLAGATPVAAHALPVTTDPSAGSILQQTPLLVTMTFNEAPDPTLSYIQVLDTAGRHHEVGRASANSSDPRTFSVVTTNMGKGVYTVSWLTVASDDGHRIAGSFTFGIQVAPPPPVSTQEESSTSALTPLGLGSRAVFYLAGVFLLGGIFITALVGPSFSGRLRRPLAIAALLAIVGVVGITDSQLRSAGAGWDQLFNTTLWGSFTTRLVPLLVGTCALIASQRLATRVQRPLLALSGVAVALAALADAAANHARTEAIPLISVALQWLHLVAVGIWIGALVALLIVIAGLESKERTRIMERFAIVAIACLLLIAGTGAVRSLAAIGSWPGLVTTPYGAIVLAKLGLVLALAGLGAINRINAMRAAEPLHGFRRIGRIQVVVGAIALVLSSALVNIAPPSAIVTIRTGPAPLIANGTDGNTLKLHLEVAPGTVGFNHFTITLTDFTTGAPVGNAKITLGFLFTGTVKVGTSSLQFTSHGDGIYSADGANLSFAGNWNITAEVQTAQWIYEVPLQLTTREAAPTA